MIPASRPDPETLLAHAVFVASVAGATLRGEDLADDVVQETWVAALQGGPRRLGALKSWLGAVTRRQAANLVRKRSAQRRRDQRAARPHPTPSTSELVIRAETGRALVAAVLSLDEIYRESLLLRFYQGLSPREIADHLCVPQETVRTRLKRGLQQLRDRLEAEYGGGPGGWIAAVTPIAALQGMAAGTTAAAAAAGGVIVAKKVAAVLVVILLAGGAALWFESRRDEPVEVTPKDVVEQVSVPSDTAEEIEPPAPPQQPVQLPEPTPPAPPKLEGRPPATVPEEPPDTPEPAPTPFAAGHVVDPNGTPLQGIKVRAQVLWDTPSGPQEKWVDISTERASVLAETDEAGHFAVGEVPDRLSGLVFVGPSWQTETIRDLSEDRSRNQDLRVVLQPGRRLVGQVQDTAGAPIPLARVSVLCGEERPFLKQFTRTDAQGRYKFESLRAERVRFSVAAAGYKGIDFKELPEDTTRKDVVLHRDMLIMDVVDAGSGDPMGQARAIVYEQKRGEMVGLLVPSSRPGWETPPGRIIERLPLRGRRGATRRGEAHVFAPGYITQTHEVDCRRGREPPHMRVALQPGDAETSIDGHVLGATTAQVELRRYTPRLGAPEELLDLSLLQTVSTGEGGAFAFRGIPSGSYRLVVHAPDRGSIGLDVEVPSRDLTIRLEEAASLEIRASHPSGTPAAGAHLTVQPHGYTHRWYVTTDAAGIAKLSGLTPGKVDIIPEKIGHMKVVGRHKLVAEIEVKPGEDATADVLVPELVPVVFLVRDATGQPARDFAMRLMGIGHSTRVEVLQRVMALELKTDDQGRATADLYPGPYRVRPATAKVFELATEFEVGLQPGPPIEVAVPSGKGTIFGRLVESGSGDPIPRRRVYVGKAENHAGWLGVGTTDEEGRYRVIGLPGGRLRVVFAVRSKPGGIGIDPASPYPSAHVEVKLAPNGKARVHATVPRVRGDGAAEHTFELSFTVRDKESGEALPGSVASAEGLIDGVWIGVGQVQTGEDGIGRGPILAAEKYRVRVFGPRSAKGSPSHSSVRLDATPADGLVTVDVDLVRGDGDR